MVMAAAALAGETPGAREEAVQEATVGTPTLVVEVGVELFSMGQRAP